MIKPYKVLRRGCQLSLAAALLLAGKASAQNAFTYSGTSAANISGTFNDLAAATTSILIPTANTDDANSTPQSIGFTFSYNSTAFTQFVLNTNGLIRLGGVAPSAANMFLQSEAAMAAGVDPVTSTNAADVNLLMPFNFDLEAGTAAAEYRVQTSGTAGSRVCTIQWKNVSDKNGDAFKQYANFTFQVKLYETSNQIEFVYGPATSSANTPDFRLTRTGIKGTSYNLGQNVMAAKGSNDAWAAAIFQTGGDATLNFRALVVPDAGRTYRFTTCTPLTITTFPYSENFNGIPSGSVPCGASGTDANGDLYTWTTDNFGSATAVDNVLYYTYNMDDPTVGGNDWYYTPALSLRAGYTYQLKFDYAVEDATLPEGLEVKWGNAATPAGQTTTLFSNTSLINETVMTTTTSQVAIIKPTTTGLYYIGFHEISAGDAYNLYIDNMVVTETKVLAVKNGTNTLFSAEASPVPFGSTLNLNLNTREAGALHLTLRDALGRTLRQTTATATVGSSTIAVPSVADLPAGVYFLNVEQAGQTQVLRVTHE